MAAEAAEEADLEALREMEASLGVPDAPARPLVVESRRRQLDFSDSALGRLAPAGAEPRASVGATPLFFSRQVYASARIPGSGEFAAVTGQGGARMYLARDSEAEQDARFEALDAWGKNLHRARHSLLAVPVAELLRQVEEADRERAIANSMGGGDGARRDATEPAPVVETQLWVDKYSPKAYPELLSEEQINREVLTWLKRWDTSVFGRKKRAAPDAAPSDAATFGSPAKRRKFNASVDEQQDDPLGRPREKVLLLCGPPGLGKTTLAHIVARHAGYVPMEINASDDRSAEALAARVRNAVEMRSVFGDGKPNCVIIDEIDGAMAGSEGRSAIGALLQVIEGKLARRGKKRGSTAMATASSSSSVPSGGGGEEDDDGDAEAGGEGEVAGSSSGSGGGGGSGGLRRPIICICNDQYVPALRPLRQVARVHVFSQPSRSALLARLRFICREEKMAADLRTLTALCDTMDSDIRACLNLLQFVHARGVKRLSADMVNSLSLAAKDGMRDRLAVWMEILKQQKVSRVLPPRPGDAEGIKRARDSAAARHQQILAVIHTHGNYEKTIEGVYENYLRVPMADPNFVQPGQVMDWICFTDLLEREGDVQGSLAMAAYIPYALLGVHTVVATARTPRLQMPKRDFLARTARQQGESIVRSVLSVDNALSRSGVSARTFVLDYVSPLLDLISPNVRPVNQRMMSAREKADFAAAVSVMSSLKMSYCKPSYAIEGGMERLSSCFDPAIDKLVEFDRVSRALQQTVPPWMQRVEAPVVVLWPNERKTPAPALLEMLKHEVECELIRRFAARAKEAEPPGLGPALAAVHPAKLAEEQEPHAESSDADGEDDSGAKKAAAADSSALSLSVPPPPPQAAHRTIASMFGARPRASPDGAAPPRASSGGPSRPLPEADKPRPVTFLDAARPSSKAAQRARPQFSVHFKYQEGFSNAVRRPVLVKEFL